jgi:hypothetical protein
MFKNIKDLAKYYYDIYLRSDISQNYLLSLKDKEVDIQIDESARYSDPNNKIGYLSGLFKYEISSFVLLGPENDLENNPGYKIILRKDTYQLIDKVSKNIIYSRIIRNEGRIKNSENIHRSKYHIKNNEILNISLT